MAVLNARQFNKLYWFTCTVVFAVTLLRTAMVPFAHDEVATFNFYIQPGSFIPFHAHVDAMGHFLTCATSWLSFKLFGSSVFALRLPGLLSFLILCVAVFKFNSLFHKLTPKLILTTAFITCYHFTAFFSLMRGYGISMAFLCMALFYFICYARHLAFRHLLKFVFFSQLALAANLTLVFVLLLTTGILMLFQLRASELLKLKTLLILAFHFGLIAFWIKFAFFLKENGALYYGEGDSYWQVTFKSLIKTIALDSYVITILAGLLFLACLFYFTRETIRHKFIFLWQSNFALLFSSLLSLALAFFLLKKLYGVNYPEDRAGLFLYLFFMLSVAFMAEEFLNKGIALLLPVPLFFTIHFFTQVNFRVHPWRIYETVPQRFFDRLASEQQKSKEALSIGGWRLTELLVAFMNYNSANKISQPTAPEAMQMNCDYAIAYAQDKPWYDSYYTELDSENDWGYRLLKRKTKPLREVVYEAPSPVEIKGSYEFYNAFEKLDTAFTSENSLLAEFELSVDHAPVPLNAWLVMEISGNGGESQFVRSPLNLVMYNWNGVKKFKTCLVSGSVPLKIKRIVCYLWNINSKELIIKIESFRLFRLNGEGVNELSKAKY